MSPSSVNGDVPTSKPTEPKEIESRLFINGEYVPSLSGQKFDVYNPATEKLTVSVYEAGAEDVDVAVKAAKAAFPAWSGLSAVDRAAYLFKLADALDKVIPEVSYLDAVSMGKPVSNDFSSAMASSVLRYFAGKAMDIAGETSLNTAGMVNISFRQPYGVCGAIIPWNVPLIMLAMKVGPALVCGNTLVLKSSEKAPLSPLLVGRLAQEIGLPPGVLNILSGYGRPCGEAITKHMQIRKVAFTGSAATGRAVKKAAAESNLKNVTLELGGKSPLIIFEDADLDKAVPAAAVSILANSGQVCVASSRVYVHESVAGKFLEKLKATMDVMGSNPKTGNDPRKEGTNRGPQADKIQFDRVMSYLKSAQDAGYEIPLGGGRDGSQGYYIQPTIISNPPGDSKVMRDEIFGPVVCVNTFTDEAEVMEQANDTEYGLYASVFTRDLSRAMRVAKGFEAGTVAVNCTSPTFAWDCPIGGWKGSGDGVEMSKHATDHWTELKSVLIML